MNRRHEFRKARRVLRWSQHELSKRARIERTKLSLYENGHIALQPKEEKRLEAALRSGLQSAGYTCEAMLKQLGQQ